MRHMALGENTKSEVGKRLIFMVDDEPMLLELTKAILTKYRVETFRSGEAALEAYSGSPSLPDLVITDYAMGGMNGLELLAACRRLNPRQKALLLSGTVEEDLNLQAPSPADAFLAKPYQPRDLVEVVESLLVA